MKILLLGQNKIFFECLNTVQKNQIITFNVRGIITDKFGINYLKKKDGELNSLIMRKLIL